MDTFTYHMDYHPMHVSKSFSILEKSFRFHAHDAMCDKLVAKHINKIFTRLLKDNPNMSPFILLPNGQTVGEYAIWSIREQYRRRFN